MIDELDLRLAFLADGADDSSWIEVVRRAKGLRRRRRLRSPLVVAAALTLAIVVAAPAIALRGRIVRLFADAPPAPHRIVKSFEAWQEFTGPRLEADRAVKVLDARVPQVGPDATVTLWLAPLRGGGFCTGYELGGGECNSVAYNRLSVTVSLHGVAPDGETLTGPVLLDGYTSLERADSLVLRFEDGETASVPLVWVTAPVDAGFFVYGVPERHWQKGHRPTTLTLLAADGDKLDSREINGITIGGSYPARDRH
jgi:hypothetical protein